MKNHEKVWKNQEKVWKILKCFGKIRKNLKKFGKIWPTVLYLALRALARALPRLEAAQVDHGRLLDLLAREDPPRDGSVLPRLLKILKKFGKIRKNLELFLIF